MSGNEKAAVSQAAPALNKRTWWQTFKKYRVLTLMCLPAIVFFFAFNYMPGSYVAFVK